MRPHRVGHTPDKKGGIFPKASTGNLQQFSSRNSSTPKSLVEMGHLRLCFGRESPIYRLYEKQFLMSAVGLSASPASVLMNVAHAHPPYQCCHCCLDCHCCHYWSFEIRTKLELLILQVSSSIRLETDFPFRINSTELISQIHSIIISVIWFWSSLGHQSAGLHSNLNSLLPSDFSAEDG